MDDSQSGKSVLENIRRLRFFDGDEAEFWDFFLQNVSILCKSPCVVYFAKNESGIKVMREYYYDESLKVHNSLFVEMVYNLAERSYQNGFAYESLPQTLPRITHPFVLVFKIDTGDAYEFPLILIIADKSKSQQFNDIVVRTQLINDIPGNYYRNRSKIYSDLSNDLDDTLSLAMEISNNIMHKDVFLLACMTLVNESAYSFNCSQISFGWLRDNYIRTITISHVETFDKHSEAVRELEGVQEESYEQNEVIAYPKIGDVFVIDKMHEEYCKKRNLSQVISIPFYIDGKAVAIMTCEKNDSIFTVTEIDILKMIAAQTAPWLNALHYKHLWLGKRLEIRAKQFLNSWFGVEHSALKAVTVILALALLYCCIDKWEYKVEGSVTLRTDAVSFISAPYDGIIQEVKIQEGNEVKKGDTLLSLDTKELLLKEAQSLADTVRYAREADKSRASEALGDMRIALSRLDEAKATLEKIRYQLGQANAVSPFNGIVVEGDRQKLIGAPVSKGDVLLKIAKVEGMYVHVKISERDIDGVTQGAKGELIFLGRPWNTYKINVDKIVPMAEVDQREGNVFIVRATINDKPELWWRPGMSGMAKIEAGKRRVIWILTHRLIEFIRIYFWW